MPMSDSNDSLKDIYLVDGSAYIFRAYHALPPLTNPEGVPVGAVLGFTNMLVKLLNEMKAPYIAVIFDAARKNFRNDIYDLYKANREAPPEDLIPQFGLIREATKAFGIEPLELEGFEADDLIATYARQATEQGRKVTIVSSDKDLMQLVNTNVSMFDPMKGRMIGIEEVIEKFGVAPDKVTDVQALAGDSIDNVPGVPGIGIKTAAQLINEYGDLETLLARAEEIKQPKRRDALIDHAEAARISKKLVSLDAYVNVPYALDDLKIHETTRPELTLFLEKQGFHSLLTRLGSAPKAVREQNNIEAAALSTPAIITMPPITDNEYLLVTDAETLETWVTEAGRKGLVAFDTETTHLTPMRCDLVGISLAITPGRAAYIPLGHKSGVRDLLSPDGDKAPDQMDWETARDILKPLLENPAILKIAQNAKYDWQVLKKCMDINVSPIDDTMLVSYVLGTGMHGHGMDELALLYLDHKTIPYKDVAGTGKSQVTFDYVPLDKALAYAAEDADITLRLWHILKPRLIAEKMVSVYERLERALVPVISRMESNGILIDRQALQRMSNAFGSQLIKLEQDIHTLAGHAFNVASPKQLGIVLFEEMGLQGGKKTKTGDWSTNVEILEQLASQGHDIIDKILDWRQLSKLKSTYTDALQEQIAKDTGRVHTSYSLAGTSTGRLASSDPNLQNIPIRTEEGRRIREAFIAPEGHSLLSIDYSQVELRLIASMANIPALKRAFINGHDIHAITASEVFGVPLSEMTGDIRRKAKAINFGIIYGISGYGLARQLSITPAEANEYIKLYFKRFPELANYMESVKEEARSKGYIETLFGRRCWVRGIRDKNHNIRSGAERQAINAPIQGTAADIMKRAMITVDQAICSGDIPAKMLLQVHDELVFEVLDAYIDEAATKIRKVMENVVTLDVPLIAEAGSAKNWAEAH